MRVNRFLAAAAALFIAVLPARADQILGPGRIDNSGRVMLPGGPKLGTYQNGKFTSQPDALKLGPAQEAFAANSVATTGTASSGSTTLTVASASGASVGDVVNAPGVPLDTQIQAISGNTITLTKATTAALSSTPIRFGADRWDLGSLALGNSIGARSVFIGAAAQGKSTWLSQVGAGGSDYYQVSPLTVLNPHGGVAATFGVRMSDEINNPSNLGGIIGAHIESLVDQQTATPKNSWGLYNQGTLLPNAVGYHLNEENSISSQWPAVDVDPYTVNPFGRTVNLRLDSGIGPGVGGIYTNVKNTSTYIDMVNNGASARSGINVGVGALDTTSGRIAPFVQMPPNVSATWYGAAGTRVWDLYASATGGYGKLELLNGEARLSSPGAGMAVGISGAASTGRAINLYTAGSQRWQVGATSTAEGGNAGSDFAVARFSDAGAYLGIPLLVLRSNGQVQMPNVAITGGAISGTNIALAPYTVATLPTCNTAAKGTMVMATDVSAAPTYRQTGLTGGGSVAVPVFCNGSAYEAH